MGRLNFKAGAANAFHIKAQVAANAVAMCEISANLGTEID